MIIWGSRGREIETDSGRFHCPQCDAERHYTLIRVATYFTLYFIALFETQHHGDYVRCDRCHGQFRPEVLDYEPPSSGERALQSVRADLDGGTPLQMARTKLVNAGVEPEVAQRLVAAAAGEPTNVCVTCDLTYVKDVPRCSGCGATL